MTPDLEQATVYICVTLLKSGGTFNFLHLEGKKFKNEQQRFDAIDYLLRNDYIVKVQGSFKLVHRLTEKGKSFVYRECFNKVLQHLSDNDEGFKQVSEILKELYILDENDELANAISIKLRKDDLVFETEESGVMINENGRQLLVEQKFSLRQQNEIPHIINSGVFIQNSQINQSPFSNSGKSLTQTASELIPSIKQKEVWWRRMLSNNWSITIIGGLIVALISAFLVFYFKWQ